MRRLLRAYAAVLVFAALLTAVVFLVWGAVELFAHPPPRREGYFSTAVAGVSYVLAVGVVAAAGGGLWCLAGPTRPPAPPPGRSRMRVVLQCLAVGQLVAGVLAAALAVWLEYVEIRKFPELATNGVINRISSAAVRTFMMLTFACIGGLLWCAARVAYPRPVPCPAPSPPSS